MTSQERTMLTVSSTVAATTEKVWTYWTKPEHIVHWNAASDDWHTTRAENDLRVGGKFTSRMEAKDGSFGFDFGGTYDSVHEPEYIEYTLGDGRKVMIHFTAQGSDTLVTEHFEPETVNAHELQLGGWQAILNNFRKYVETN